MPNSATRVIVGLSGGVDSSVAALLLKEQGYEVHGLFMKNWEEDDTNDFCSAAADVADAKAVCEKLGIPLHTVNFAAEYWDNVFEYFLQEYRAGRTPNPDILCNREIKFKAFLDYALHLGADYIATGHYALTEKPNSEHTLLKGADPNKDQSYFLYTLGQKQLAKTLFPIGNLPKPQVREIAAKNGFINHAKKDSTGICFIGERRFKEFLARYLPAQPGPIETAEGKVIGQHDGLMYYTLGQRRDLKIGGRKDSSGDAWYVAKKDLKRNTLIVVQGSDHPLLFAEQLFCSQLSWISGKEPVFPLNCAAKTRYRQQEVACQVKQIAQQLPPFLTFPRKGGRDPQEASLLVTFSEPQRSITPGQSIVFYQENICLGGGIIDSV